MGFVSGLLGTAGGAGGSGFAAPRSANILNPVNIGQAGTAYGQTQQALSQQQAFLNALNAQNGLSNQTAVFNQLQNIASGQGPNPAIAQLNQATAANTANQAALMAGQRGAGQNVGLIARQAAQQGAANQQQAAGQAATLQAQQSLQALNQLQGLSTQQVAQQQQQTNQVSNAYQQEQQNILNAIAQQNNANVGMQSNINQGNAALAGQNMTGQQNLLGNVVGGAGAALSSIFAEGGEVKDSKKYAQGDMVSYDPNNQDKVDYSSGQVTPATAAAVAPVKPASTNPNAPQSSFGKFMKGMSSAPTTNTPAAQPPTGLARAGQTIGQGIGNLIASAFGPGSPQEQSKSQVPTEDQYAAFYGAPGTRDKNGNPTEEATYQMMTAPQPQMAKGGKVPALVSPGEKYLTPKDVKKVEKGMNPMAVGETIPGKPKVKGAVNSYANDTVHRNLDEGGIVLPRSVTQAKDPAKEAHKFVSSLMAKKGKSIPKRK